MQARGARGVRPCKPNPAMILATVFPETGRPSAHSSEMILGES